MDVLIKPMEFAEAVSKIANRLPVASRLDTVKWSERWRTAGGQFYDGRMIAKKSDAVWQSISRFGTPWPPYDFGSGMGVEDVSREEAEALGILRPDEPVTGDEKGFNDELSGSVRDLDAEGVRKVVEQFGDDVTLHDGRLETA